MPNRYIAVSGSFKEVQDNYIGVGGAWKTVKERYIGVGGVWEKVWPSVDQVLGGTFSAGDLAINNGFAQAELVLQSDGTVRNQDSVDQGDYVENTPVDGSLYEIVVTSVSAGVSGPSTGTYGLGANRSWGISATGGEGTNSGTVQGTIREKADHSNSASITLNLTATSEP